LEKFNFNVFQLKNSRKPSASDATQKTKQLSPVTHRYILSKHQTEALSNKESTFLIRFEKRF
jgi:hypothetical protein